VESAGWLVNKDVLLFSGVGLACPGSY